MNTIQEALSELNKQNTRKITEAKDIKQFLSVKLKKKDLKESYDKYSSFDFIDGANEDLYKQVFDKVWEEVSPEYKIVMVVNSFQSGSGPDISGWRGCIARIYFLPEADWNEMFVEGDGLASDYDGDSYYGYLDILDNARYFCIDFDLGRGYGCPTFKGEPVFRFKRNDVESAKEKIIATFDNK